MIEASEIKLARFTLSELAADRPYLSVAWAGRAENARQLAVRTLELIHRVDDRLGGAGSWSIPNTHPDIPMALEQDGLTEFIDAHHATDDDNQRIGLLGYRYALARHKAPSTPEVVIEFSRVGSATSSHRRLGNMITLSFRGDPEPAVITFARFAPALLVDLATVWQPDVGGAGSLAQIKATWSPTEATPEIAAVSWLSPQFPIPPEIPGAVVVPAGGGKLVVLGGTNAADLSVNVAVAVRRYLLENEFIHNPPRVQAPPS